MAVDLTKQQLMFSLIEMWKQNNGSQREFCREKELDYHQFQYWFRRYKKLNNSQSEIRQSGFMEVKVKERIINSAAIELIFPDGRKLIFHQPVDVSFLRSLLN
jgi:hypothetical protein